MLILILARNRVGVLTRFDRAGLWETGVRVGDVLR